MRNRGSAALRHRLLVVGATLPLVLLAPSPAFAQVYKCLDALGNPTYSQLPCEGRETSRVELDASRASDTDCRWATRFARDIAVQMRAGRSARDTIDTFGGVDAAGTGTLNVINYVYRFDSARDVPVERITTLATSMCAAGQLGDVRCEALPFAGDDPDRCEADGPGEYETRRTQAADVAEQVISTESEGGAAEPAPAEIPASGSNENVETCKDPIRDEIDAIYDAMRTGYDAQQGERFRERLRGLSARYRDCERLQDGQ